MCRRCFVCFHSDCYMSPSLSSFLLEHFSFHRSKKKRVRCTEDSLDIEASSTFCLLNFLTFLQSQYRHLHAPGPRRSSVGGISSVYSNCTGSTSPTLSRVPLSSLANTWRPKCVLVQIGDASYPVCDAGFSGSQFGVQGTELNYHTEGGYVTGLETWAKATLTFTIFHQRCVVKLAFLTEVRLPFVLSILRSRHCAPISVIC